MTDFSINLSEFRSEARHFIRETLEGLPFDEGKLLERASLYASENIDAMHSGGANHYEIMAGSLRGKYSLRRLEHCQRSDFSEDPGDLLDSTFPDALLEIATRQWAEGKPDGFAMAWFIFRKRLIPIMIRYFSDTIYASQGEAEALAESAFDHTIEELDLIVCGGANLVKAKPVGSDGSTSSGTELSAQLTGRNLGARKKLSLSIDDPPPAWRGSVEFQAFARNISIKRCIDVLRKERKEIFRSDGEGVTDFDNLASPQTSATSDSIASFLERKRAEYSDGVEAFRFFSEDLTMKNQHTSSEIADVFASYYVAMVEKIDTCLNRCENSMEPLLILFNSEPSPEKDKWIFVRRALKIDDTTFYQRKSRFLKWSRECNDQRVLSLL